MGYRSFNEKTTLDDARERTEYTFEALDAHAAPAVKDLAKSVSSHLDLCETVEKGRRTARRATVRANARVRMRDGDTDDTMREFGKDVLALVRQDRTAPLFRLFFPDPIAAVVNLSLAPELDAIETMISSLGDHSVPPDFRKKWVPIWKKIVAAGREALDERTAAARETVSSAMDVERWISRADRLRRVIDGALTKHAAENGLSADFNDRFFPAASRTRKNGKSADNNPPRDVSPPATTG